MSFEHDEVFVIAQNKIALAVTGVHLLGAAQDALDFLEDPFVTGYEVNKLVVLFSYRVSKVATEAEQFIHFGGIGIRFFHNAVFFADFFIDKHAKLGRLRG